MSQPNSSAPGPDDPGPDPAQVDELLDQLLDQPAEKRAQVLADPKLDPDLRARVGRLLELVDDPPPRFEEPVVSEEAVLAASPLRRVGSYVIQGVIGSGAMGIVYRAEQDSPKRGVALKLMRSAVEDRAGAVRFEREAQLLGRLQHAGIAQIHEFGTAELETGPALYIAMERVDGVPLQEYVASAQPELRQRVELLAELCDAIHHAHLRGVLHRDLKPSNVLVTAEGHPKVIDFGVARALEDDVEHWRATLAGEVVGTLAYMSPEQVRGDLEQLDARTDVYSLGALGYELLSGRLPHELAGMTLATASRTIAERDVPRLGSIAPKCRGDLEWVIGQALAKESSRRYQSAHALAADLRRWLAYEPVDARPASALYQLRRFTQRHRAMVSAGAVSLLAIVTGAGVAVDKAIENKALAELEEAARLKAERRTEELERRTGELERMTDAMSGQLRSIDARSVAQELRAAMLEELDAELAAGGVNRAALDQVDMIGVALRGLNEGLFRPAVENLMRTFPDDPSSRAALLDSLADAELNVGLPRAAEEHFRGVRSIWLELDGAESERSLIALLDVASALAIQGRSDQAMTVLGPHAEELHAAIARTPYQGRYLRLRALVARWQGDLEAAASFYEQAAVALGPLPETLLDAEHWDPFTIERLSTRSDLGVVLCQLDRFDEGLPAIQSVLDRLVEVPEPTTSLRVKRWGVQMDYAIALCRSGSAARGEPLAIEAVAGAASELGDLHSVTAMSRGELGRWYAETERYGLAEPLLLAADEALVREGGEDHPSRYAPLLMLTRCALDGRRLSEARRWAEALYELTSTTYERRPAFHRHGILNLRVVAMIYASLGDFPQWEPRVDELTAELEALEGGG